MSTPVRPLNLSVRLGILAAAHYSSNGIDRVYRGCTDSVSSLGEAKDEQKAVNVKSRQEIKREYKERGKPAGIFQVKNLANGKVLLGSSLNLEGPLNSHKFMLTIGRHRNEELQNDWNEYGPENFVFEILEVVEPGNDPGFDLNDELALIEQIWIERLQPFGNQGYNQGTKIRQA